MRISTQRILYGRSQRSPSILLEDESHLLVPLQDTLLYNLLLLIQLL
jgi:hypothetical protein